MKNKVTLISTLSLLFALSACLSETFDSPQKLGGKWVSARTLNLGHDTYMNYCMQCHGIQGDGKGPASQGMVPAPRNFTAGMFKFGTVAPGDLPTDEDLKHIIKFGLNGTQMLPWDISPERLDAVIQYIKTFSPEWRNKIAGTSIERSKDPFGPAKASEAIALGKKVYHGLAQCYACHPSYATLEEIGAYSKEMTGNVITTIRENAHISMLQASSYDNHSYMPPDFTRSHLRSINTLDDIYARISVGVNGTAMNAWKGMLSLTGDEAEDQQRLWALAYYVSSLQSLRWDWQARKAFFQDLNAKRSVQSSAR